MMLKVLIVDDSPFFQRQLKSIIDQHSELSVIGVANNGREAIEKVTKLKPDLVTMDYEMPMMDGISAVKIIMAENPVPIMMLSSMTYEGARITLDALDAGAVDFMTKNFSEISNNSPAIRQRICAALLAIGNKKLSPKAKKINLPTQEAIKQSEQYHKVDNQDADLIHSNSSHDTTTFPSNIIKPKMIVIGASTGGPAALTELISQLSPSFTIPIIIVQHMPENFTRAFAERLNNLTHLTIKEGEMGDTITENTIYLAPGGKQCIIDSTDNKKLKIIDGTEDMNYKPSVDITFASVSNYYGKDALAIVLTGMGSDGCKGASLLKNTGAMIWTQEKDNCLIYGMPMAVDKAKLSNASYTITEMYQKLNQL